MKRPDADETEFLNVDLEVFSRETLAPFAGALGRSWHILHVGHWGRRHAACLELTASGYGQGADAIILRMTRLLNKMPRSAKVLWNRAHARQFNIGVEAAVRSRTFELHLRPDTLQAVARLGGKLVVTVYAPERRPAAEESQSNGRRRPTKG